MLISRDGYSPTAPSSSGNKVRWAKRRGRSPVKLRSMAATLAIQSPGKAHCRLPSSQIGDPTIADSILDRLAHNAYRIELKGKFQLHRRTLKKNQSHDGVDAGSVPFQFVQITHDGAAALLQRRRRMAVIVTAVVPIRPQAIDTRTG